MQTDTDSGCGRDTSTCNGHKMAEWMAATGAASKLQACYKEEQF